MLIGASICTLCSLHLVLKVHSIHHQVFFHCVILQFQNAAAMLIKIYGGYKTRFSVFDKYLIVILFVRLVSSTARALNAGFYIFMAFHPLCGCFWMSLLLPLSIIYLETCVFFLEPRLGKKTRYMLKKTFFRCRAPVLKS